ncbi:hypothetical protein LR48_Vigan01g137900 [Vigna angularis]|uniref:CCHC-type domain-containing protein n=1 Tax=Phaseolus angularis TaxID=3914 RepID=A0A0L9TMK4_PHAAN|nr:hypothetical protein LR48_Vigan01g137900 [Vigna angularis]
MYKTERSLTDDDRDQAVRTELWKDKLALCVSKVGAVLFKLVELFLLIRLSKEVSFGSFVEGSSTSNSSSSSDCNEKENLCLMANGESFGSQFLKKKKENQGYSSSFKCYRCGERGHMKVDCLNNKRNEERKEKKFPKKKKAYIEWEENVSSSSSSSESDEEANLCLMVDLKDAGSQEKFVLCVSKVGVVLFKLEKLLLLVRFSKEALPVRLSKEDSDCIVLVRWSKESVVARFWFVCPRSSSGSFVEGRL